MQDITEIMDMLDWHKLPEIQTKGIAQAKDAETIRPFIQPLTPEHNKNVWENCAAIIAEKSDEKLRPYLAELLEWVQDMNWPVLSASWTDCKNTRTTLLYVVR